MENNNAFHALFWRLGFPYLFDFFSFLKKHFLLIYKQIIFVYPWRSKFFLNSICLQMTAHFWRVCKEILHSHINQTTIYLMMGANAKRMWIEDQIVVPLVFWYTMCIRNLVPSSWKTVDKRIILPIHKSKHYNKNLRSVYVYYHIQ